MIGQVKRSFLRIKARVYVWVKYEIFHLSEGQYLPRWFRPIQFLFRPFEMAKWFLTNHGSVYLNYNDDTVTVNGMRFGMCVFELLNNEANEGRIFMLKKVQPDGVIEIENMRDIIYHKIPESTDIQDIKTWWVWDVKTQGFVKYLNPAPQKPTPPTGDVFTLGKESG